MNTFDSLDTLGREARHGLRSLGRSPAFTLAALVMLAMGIGASTSAFTVVTFPLTRVAEYLERRWRPVVRA